MGRPRELTEAERQKLIAEGYKPVEVWVPDFSDPRTLALAKQEAKRIAAADDEEGIVDWVEALQKDMWEGEDQL